MRENPRAPPDVWFGIGLNYFLLGNLLKAKMAFEKTVELDS